MASVNTDLATTLTTATDLTALNSVAGRSAVLIGGTETGYGSISSSTMVKIGAVDGTVSVANNQEIVKLQSSALQNPYAAINTAYDFQVTFTLQEVDLPNVALSLGLKASDAMVKAIEHLDLIGGTGAASGSNIGAEDPGTNSSIAIPLTDTTTDMSGVNITSDGHGMTTENDAGRMVAIPSANGARDQYEIREFATRTSANIFTVTVAVTTDGASVASRPVYKSAYLRKLDMDAASPGAYRSMRIVTLGAQATDGTVEHMGWDFYKVKIVSQGTVDFDRTAAISLPITAHCLGNSSDVVGRVWHTNEITARGYPG